MMSKSPRFAQLPVDDERTTVTEAWASLRAKPASVAPKFFYNELGSRLFDAITALPEYYPTRTERSIFDQQASAIARALLAQGASSHGLHTLVDLGAGNCEKAERLFAHLQPKRYVAVDISSAYLEQVLVRMQRLHPALDIVGLGTDFSQSFQWPTWLQDGVGAGSTLMFYPGSSIGNFTPPEALALVSRVRAAVPSSGLLIGVDLAKPASVVVPAYDDALGVTAAFNLNMLAHLNERLGTDFELADWRHVALLNERESRIEMHLEARRNVVVTKGDESCSFVSGERILTEYSYKWQRRDFEGMLRGAGYASVQSWTDERGWFAVFLAL